jgi:hypothetical protein
MDSLLNLLAPKDHIPLGITWVASQLLEFITALFGPVPFHIIVIPKDHLFTSALCPIRQKLFYNQNQGIHLVIALALSSGLVQLGGLISEYVYKKYWSGTCQTNIFYVT